ncbi:PREDICTED: methyl-CpG-binding domain-containing protein 7-like [Camelina sativa]|uniref:Methyl-CpG-binding domain-containing protein 7-like n=1 Tax=Camelina sativa TaxID=90675 RepID=A0ABM0VFV6_CAMSA|nr:PREDICTED: methyl-CpG-binding domain-containing protein 7-like [Camelina sativa]
MQTRSSSSSPSPDESQLQIVNTISFRGKILPGWTVVNRPRSSRSGSTDTYFIEPGTGRKFSSLEAVHRHLSGEVSDRRLTRAGSVFQERTRVYERSITKQEHRNVEYASKGFRLPKGWSVEEVPRKNSHSIDKYYVERKTRKRFRSLVSVERYLKESGNHTDQQLMLVQYRRRSKDFRLPDGWIIEEKPRKSSTQIDRSYIDPETGNKFRSMAAVERYLLAVGAADSVSMVQSNQLALAVNRNDTRFLKEVIDPNPPKKVKWVLTGPGGNMFTAKVSGSDVSSSVKQTWSEAFVSMIQDRS